MTSTQEGLLASASAAAGAIVACSAVIASPATDLLVSEEQSVFPSAFLSSAWAGTVAVLTAVACVALLSRIPRRGAAALVGVVGSLTLAAPAAVDVSTAVSVTLAGLGTGMVLGASVTIAHGRRAASTFLAVGAVSTFAFSDMVANAYPDRFRWSITLPGDTFYPGPVVPLPTLLVAAVAFAGVVTLPPNDSRVRRGSLWGTTVIALVSWCAHVFLGNMTSTPTLWTVAVAVTVVAIVGVAVRIGGDGAFVIGAVALAATSVATMHANAWWLIALAAVGFGIGGWCAWHRPSVTIGCGFLSLVCASAFLPDTTFSTVAYAVVLPAAAVYTLVSGIPDDAAVMAAGVMIPAMLAVFTTSAYWIGGYDFGWEPIAPTTTDPDRAIDPGTVNAAIPTAVVAALCTAVIATGAAPYCSTRRTARR
ncbi:hypothetical protein ACNHUS_23240 [Actinomycetes bacterium M1A6_2h]